MILAVARTHFAKLKRDRAAFVLAFIVPVVFFSVFASIFSGSSSRAATRQISIAVVDEDGTPNSRRFVEALKREKGLRVIDVQTLPDGRKAPIADAAAAEGMVRRGDVPLALIVPKGFGSAPIRFGPATGAPAIRIAGSSPVLIIGLDTSGGASGFQVEGTGHELRGRRLELLGLHLARQGAVID